jgi:hypothetical protein
VDTYSRLSNDTLEAISRRYQDAGQLLSDAERRILDGVTREARAAAAELPRIESSTLLEIDDTLRRIAGQSETLQGATVDAIVASGNILLEVGEAQTAAVVGAIEGASAESKASLKSALQGVTEEIARTGGEASQAARSLEQAVTGALRESSGEARRSAQETSQAVARAVDLAVAELRASDRQLTGAVGAQVSALAADQAASTAGVLGKLGEVLGSVGGLGDALADPIGALIDALQPLLSGISWWALFELLGVIGEERDRNLDTVASRVLGAIDPDSRVTLDSWREVERELPDSPVLRGLAGLAIALLAAPRVVWELTGLRAQRISQEYALQSPWALLPVPDLIDAWRRDLIELPDALLGIRRQGLSEEDAITAVALRRQTASSFQLLDWWLRGLVPEPRVREELRAQGFDTEDVERWIKGATRPPPLSDLIHMAVREVFSPDLRAALDLDASYPEVLTKHARSVGLNEEWARAYWAAHWTLPSVSQALAMRHRDVIDDRELDQLLQAQDIAPVWRERIKAIAYLPLTRVDLRRMYALGELDEEGLTRGYLDLGYSPENADRLTRFAVVERQRQRAELGGTFRGLTPAQLREAVHDRLVERSEVLQELVDRGYDPRAAEIFLQLTSQGTPPG